MILSLIVAHSRNRAIGKDNKLLWHLKDDMKKFVSATKGKYYLMGRKTFDSIGKPLPNRVNIIISRNDQYIEGVTVKGSIESAIEFAKEQGANELVIGGGEEIYKLALPMVSRMYITKVHTEVDGDTFFPEFDEGEWEQVISKDFTQNEGNDHGFEYCEYVKKENLYKV
jgi:dihydrofolate reductase